MAGNTRIRVPAAAGPDAVVSCWMCGIRLNRNYMVADGAGACDDVRWYCRDARACTERWTATRSRESSAGTAPHRDTMGSSSQTAKPAAPGSVTPQSRKGVAGEER